MKSRLGVLSIDLKPAFMKGETSLHLNKIEVINNMLNSGNLKYTSIGMQLHWIFLMLHFLYLFSVIANFFMTFDV